MTDAPSTPTDLARIIGLHAHERGTPETIRALENISRALMEQHIRETKLSLRAIVSALALECGEDFDEFTGKSGRNFLAAERARAYCLCIEKGYSLYQIGGIFNRDHSTIHDCAQKYAHENNFTLPEIRRGSFRFGRYRFQSKADKLSNLVATS